MPLMRGAPAQPADRSHSSSCLPPHRCSNALGDRADVYLVGGADARPPPGSRSRWTSTWSARVMPALWPSGSAGASGPTAASAPARCVLDGHSYDLATARRERYARPGALPEVEPAPLAEDLRRRDFTVNALAVALGGPRRASSRRSRTRSPISTAAGCASSTTRASTTIRPACCGWPATPRGWASSRRPTPPSWHARPSRPGRWRRSAASASAPSCGCSPREPDPVAALGRLGAARARRAIHPGSASPTARSPRRRSRCCPRAAAATG